jgi:hypothetical protein
MRINSLQIEAVAARANFLPPILPAAFFRRETKDPLFYLSSCRNTL